MEQHTVALIWIDWYAYHLARFRAIAEHCSQRIRATGIELVGLDGVHAGLQFRQQDRAELPVVTLFPEESWHGAGQWRMAVATWKKLGELNPSVVFVPGYYNAPAIAAALWGKWHGRRTVLMTESTEQDHARSVWKEGLKSLMIRALFTWAIAGGEPHVEYLSKLGFPADRISRFYDVVDNDFFAAAADRLRASRHAADFDLPQDYFLYVGRLSAEKNVDGLLLAFENYRREGGRWNLVLAGEGSDRESLETLARKLGVHAAVKWAGMRSTEELAAYYAFARCFILPSTREPWGLVVNEAMAAGVPVIVSRRCGCAADLVCDGENGFLFDPAAPGELERLLHVIETSGPAAQQAMAVRSREIVANYSPRQWAAEVERIASA